MNNIGLFSYIWYCLDSFSNSYTLHRRHTLSYKIIWSIVKIVYFKDFPIIRIVSPK